MLNVSVLRFKSYKTILGKFDLPVGKGKARRYRDLSGFVPP